MTDRALHELNIEAHQRVVVAFAADLDPTAAVELAQRIGAHLDREGVSVARRCYIIGSGAGFDDTNVALLLAALEPIVDPATLMLHDPDDADALWFQRRPPGVVRGRHISQRRLDGRRRPHRRRRPRSGPGRTGRLVRAARVSSIAQADLNADVILTPD